MRNGLKIITVPGRYGRSVTRIGWLRRISGDEWILSPGARTVVWTSGSATPLDALASNGPGTDHRMSDPAKGVEEIHRLLIRRSLPADEKAWKKDCPRPKDWSNDE